MAGLTEALVVFIKSRRLMVIFSYKVRAIDRGGGASEAYFHHYLEHYLRQTLKCSALIIWFSSVVHKQVYV